MKKGFCLFLCIAFTLTGLGTFPIVGNAATTTITTGAEFVAAAMTNAANTYIIEGTQTLNDGSTGIILPDNYTPKSGFLGTLIGVTGKNNIQIPASTENPGTVSLFVSCGNGISTIENIILKGKDPDGKGLISTSENFFGVLIKQTVYEVIVKNVVNNLNITHSTGTANGVAGIIGNARKNFAMENCVNNGNITSSSAGMLGGIVGSFYNGTIEIKSCYNYGDIIHTGTVTKVGGIFGGQLKADANGTGTVSACGNYGNVSTAGNSAGGIGGLILNVNVEKCFNAGSISAVLAPAGIGIAGSNAYTITDCFNVGKISASGAVATNSYPAGVVSAGNLNPTVQNCYNIGAITGGGVYAREITKSTNAINNYYINADAGAPTGGHGGTLITMSELADSVPSRFSSDVWEYVIIEGMETECYIFPQIKGNTLWNDYQYFGNQNGLNYINKISETTGKITNLNGWVTEENVKEFTSIYAPEKHGYAVSQRATYPGIISTTVIKTNFDDKEASGNFTINKSAVIYIATDKNPLIDDISCVKDYGFEPVIRKETGEAEVLVLKGGLKYYLSQKIVPVYGEPQNISLGSAAELDHMYALFVKWADNYTLSVNNSENGTVLVDGEQLTGNLIKNVVSNAVHRIEIIPEPNCYIKSIYVNGAIEVENCLDAYSFDVSIFENNSVEINIDKYILDFSYFGIVRSSNPDGTIDQSFVIEGNAKDFMEGFELTAVISKDENTIATHAVTIESEGSFILNIPINGYETDVYSLEISVETPYGKFIAFLADQHKNIKIYSVDSINELILGLNEGTYTASDLKDSILNDEALNFNIELFKDLEANVQNKIIEQILDFNEVYTLETIYGLYENSVIMNTANRTTKPSNFEKLFSIYENTINIKDSAVYIKYKALINKTAVCNRMIGQSYLSYSDIVTQFEFAFVWNEMNNVDSYDKIIEILESYKGLLGIESQVNSINNMTDPKIKVVCEYIASKLSNMKNKQQLINVLNEAISKANSLLIDKQNQHKGGSGGSGGGGSSKGTVSIGVDNDLISVDPVAPIEGGIEVFSDLGSVGWATDSIYQLFYKGIVKGREKGMFYPNNEVTRTEYVKMIVEAFQVHDEKAKCNFIDLPEDHWSYPYVASAWEMGVVSGKPDQSFGIDENITRQDMAIILMRVIYKLELYTKFENRKYPELIFNDSDEISDYAKNAIMVLSGEGIISGYGDGNFGAKRQSTRAEAAVMICKTLDFLGKL